MDTTQSLPSGTVTFLFTDIEGSTRLWEQHPEAMCLALDRHNAILRRTIETQGGCVFKTVGDAFCAVFATAPAALVAALEAQRALNLKAWEEVGPLRVRMALHTGTAEVRAGDYFGAPLNRVKRLLDVAHPGQILLSLVTEELVRDALPAPVRLRDLGEHSLKDLRQREHVFQLLHPELPSDFPPLHSLNALPTNLPLQVTRFIGRAHEMEEVQQLLASTRLLTLTGAGGTGKSRLALQVAADLLHEYPEGVWLVELAPLTDPGLVPQSVALVLGIREEPGVPLSQTVLDVLHPKRLLLLLDNCEHLLSACSAFADALLCGCPQVRLLASSREGLNIPGETLYRVRSLSVPDLKRLPSVESLPRFDAVHLFIDRATMVIPTFTLTHQNASAVAQICCRLDGIPLAIELAAARVEAMSVETINERLEDMFRLLTGGSRTALPRHQTLRALIDWSYGLLSDTERALLRRLSVFVGGWTLEAAEAVCADPVESGQWSVVSEGITPSALSTVNCRLSTETVLDLLTALVEKSLVQYEQPGSQAGGDEGRYRFLETVRQYARDRLMEGEEVNAVRARHCNFFVSYAERAEPELVREQEVAWLARVESDLGNIRAALEWGLASEPEAALRMAGALGPFWELHGYFAEGREFLERGLGRATEVPGEVRAKALGCAGGLAQLQGDGERAKELLEGSLELSRPLGNRREIARSLGQLGVVANSQGNADAARGFIEESLAICQEIGDQWGTANALLKLTSLALHRSDLEAARPLCVESLAIHRELGNRPGIADALLNLGWMAIEEGDYHAGRSLYEESLAIHRELGNKPGILWALGGVAWAAELQGDYEAAHGFFEEHLTIARETGSRRFVARSLLRLGDVAWARGEYEAAREWYEESRALGRQMGNHWLMSDVLDGLGNVASAQGEYAEARACFEESLRIRREVGWKHRIAASLEGLAKIAAAEGEAARAARLLGAAEGLHAATPRAWSPAEREDYERSVRAARAQLDAEAFAAAWAEGRAMPLEQAVADALEAGAP